MLEAHLGKVRQTQGRREQLEREWRPRWMQKRNRAQEGEAATQLGHDFRRSIRPQVGVCIQENEVLQKIGILWPGDGHQIVVARTTRIVVLEDTCIGS
jgi:hypothetical protein